LLLTPFADEYGKRFMFILSQGLVILGLACKLNKNKSIQPGLLQKSQLLWLWAKSLLEQAYTVFLYWDM
jgi:hypothetical protein